MPPGPGTRAAQPWLGRSSLDQRRPPPRSARSPPLSASSAISSPPSNQTRANGPAAHLAAAQVGLALLAVGADPVDQEAMRLLDHAGHPGSRSLRSADRRSQNISEASVNRSAIATAVGPSSRAA